MYNYINRYQYTGPVPLWYIRFQGQLFSQNEVELLVDHLNAF
jgi:hypothetical protein